MSDAATLLALAARCECEEPSYDLDEAIGVATGWKRHEPPYADDWINPNDHRGDRLWMMARFTSSRDAAATLQPDGWKAREIWQGANEAGQDGWIALYYHPDHDIVGGWAETEAMARCVAGLQARAKVATPLPPPPTEGGS